MTSPAPIYNVTIDTKGVALKKIAPGSPAYRKAAKNVILRQRDAIERYQQLKGSSEDFHGTYSFQFLDTARTFALLRLRMMEGELQNNLDRVLAWDGGEKPKSQQSARRKLRRKS